MEFRYVRVTYQGRTFNLAYFVRPGTVPTLLFLHGLGGSKHDFVEAAHTDALRPYTIVALDLPGSGNSSYFPDLPLGIDDLVELIDAFIAALDLQDLVLVGHSMSGLVALLYIEKDRTRVRGFVNVEGNLAPEDCGFISRETVQHERVVFEQEVFPALKQRMASSHNTGFQHYAESLATRTSVKAFFDYCPSIVAYSDSGDLLQHFIALDLPKLFVYGSENAGLSYVPQLRGSSCQVIEVPGGNHFPFHDHPDRFYRALHAFIEQGR